MLKFDVDNMFAVLCFIKVFNKYTGFQLCMNFIHNFST